MKLKLFIVSVLVWMLTACGGEGERQQLPPITAPPIHINEGYGELYFGDRQMVGDVRFIFEIQVNIDEGGNANGATIEFKEIWAEDIDQFRKQAEAGGGLLTVKVFNEMPLVEGEVEYSDGVKVVIPKTGLSKGDNVFEPGMIPVFPLVNGVPNREATLDQVP